MSKLILVVEDQPDNRQIIRDMLAPTDYEITEAENGEEALAAITKQRPDLILMDIQLHHGRLRSDAPHQGRRFAALNPDHRSHVLRFPPQLPKVAVGSLCGEVIVAA
jgi:CheY-like chemotaxis protein